MTNPAKQSGHGVTLRTRLLISSLLGALPLIVLGILLLISRYSTRRDLILRGNLTLAQLAAESVGGWLDGNTRALRTLANSAEVQSGVLAEMQGLVQRQQAAQPDWTNLSVTDAAGIIIASTTGATINVSDRPYFIQAKRTLSPVVSNLLISRITRRYIIIITVPIVRNGRFQGIVSAVIQPETIRHLLDRRFAVERGTSISLWGNDRRLIAMSGDGNHPVGWHYTGHALDRAFTAREGVMIAKGPFSDRQTLLGYATVRTAPWKVVTGTPAALAMAPVLRDFALFITLALLVLGLTLGWSFYSANIVGRRVEQLAAYARAVGEGQYHEPIMLHSGDELQDLANSLNKMAADLATLDRLKSDLLTMISHELKTPLTAIRASLDLIASGAVVPDQPAYRETLEIANRQSRRLQDLIENLLNVARLQAGGLKVDPQPVLLSPIVQTAVQQYRGAAFAKGLDLQVDMPEDMRVQADRPKVTLALSNLLDNAVKYTEQGSITVRAWREDGEAVVTVTDTGIGLYPELSDRLFHQFYQAEPLLTRHAGGVGMGLWVTRAIIEAHGGRVFAESEGPGKGSTFGFTLPLAPEE